MRRSPSVPSEDQLLAMANALSPSSEVAHRATSSSIGVPTHAWQSTVSDGPALLERMGLAAMQDTLPYYNHDDHNDLPPPEEERKIEVARSQSDPDASPPLVTAAALRATVSSPTTTPRSRRLRSTRDGSSSFNLTARGRC